MPSFIASVIRRFLFNKDEGQEWPKERVYHGGIVLRDSEGEIIPPADWDSLIGKEQADRLRSEDEYYASTDKEGDRDS